MWYKGYFHNKYRVVTFVHFVIYSFVQSKRTSDTFPNLQISLVISMVTYLAPKGNFLMTKTGFHTDASSIALLANQVPTEWGQPIRERVQSISLESSLIESLVSISNWCCSWNSHALEACRLRSVEEKGICHLIVLMYKLKVLKKYRLLSSVI